MRILVTNDDGINAPKAAGYIDDNLQRAFRTVRDILTHAVLPIDLRKHGVTDPLYAKRGDYVCPLAHSYLLCSRSVVRLA